MSSHVPQHATNSHVPIAPVIRFSRHQRTGASLWSKITRSWWLMYTLPPTPDQMLHQRTLMRNDGTEPTSSQGTRAYGQARSILTSCPPTGMTSVTTKPAFSPVAAHAYPSLWFICWRSASALATLLRAHLLGEYPYMVPSFQPQGA